MTQSRIQLSLAVSRVNVLTTRGSKAGMLSS